jgi:hypothetical protein
MESGVTPNKNKKLYEKIDLKINYLKLWDKYYVLEYVSA